jgi:uncharacterized protein YqfA (UPF0365 family)
VNEYAPLLLLLGLLVMMIFMLFAFGLFALLARPWLRAAASGAPVSLLSILGMRLRGNSPTLLIDAYIALRRAGVNATVSAVEGIYIDNRTRVRTSQDLTELVKGSASSDDNAKST